MTEKKNIDVEATYTFTAPLYSNLPLASTSRTGKSKASVCIAISVNAPDVWVASKMIGTKVEIKNTVQFFENYCE